MSPVQKSGRLLVANTINWQDISALELADFRYFLDFPPFPKTGMFPA